MTRNDFIDWLKSIGARFQDCSDSRPIETVFVYGTKEYDLVHNHPKKYKNLYVPYIRVSWHPEDPRELYIRWNGSTSWSNEQTIKNIIMHGV